MKTYISADLRVINLHANDIIATSDPRMASSIDGFGFGGDFNDGTIIGGNDED